MGDGPQRAPRILIVPFIFFSGGAIELHDEFERVLVPAPEIAAEPLAFQGKHPAADLLLGLAGDALDVVADDPGAAAGEDDDEVGVVLCIRLLHRFQELSLAAVDDVALVKGGAGRGFERHPAYLAALPGPDKVGHVERASRGAVHERDDMPDAGDDIVCGKKFAHGSVRGLQLRDHLARLHLLQQLLQAAVKYDRLVLHDALSLPRARWGK